MMTEQEEPTSKGDRVAGLMREYFEQHKRDQWDGFSADNLMIGLLNIALREYRSAEPVALEALKLAISHVEHMAAWIGRTNRREAKGAYSFEALGEDLPSIKAALAPALTARDLRFARTLLSSMRARA